MRVSHRKSVREAVCGAMRCASTATAAAAPDSCARQRLQEDGHREEAQQAGRRRPRLGARPVARVVGCARQPQARVRVRVRRQPLSALAERLRQGRPARSAERVRRRGGARRRARTHGNGPLHRLRQQQRRGARAQRQAGAVLAQVDQRDALARAHAGWSGPRPSWRGLRRGPPQAHALATRRPGALSRAQAAPGGTHFIAPEPTANSRTACLGPAATGSRQDFDAGTCAAPPACQRAATPAPAPASAHALPT